MNRLRAIGALLLADLRQRLRSPRPWLLAVVLGAGIWWCLPPFAADYLTVSTGDGIRARYSSAWIGMVAALMYSSLLSVTGFYMVRGTVLRDIETRGWQLLVATTMRRTDYLLGKWLSHMVVFALIMAAGLVVGLVAQWVRAEDRSIDLVELVRPALWLSVPSLAFTAALAVWFDLVPWLRRSAGNILFFVLWISLIGVGVSTADHAGANPAPWPGDPHGLLVAEMDLAARLGSAAAPDESNGLSVGVQVLEGRHPTLAEWRTWTPSASVVRGRLTWLAIALAVLLLPAPLLDRCASHLPARTASRTAGARLAWLERALRPLQSSAFGTLLAAELRLALRSRRAWWWLAALALMATQAFAPAKAMAVAMVLGWMLWLDVLARLGQREHETRTGALVYTASGIAGRLLAVRLLGAFLLVVGGVVPGLFRLAATNPQAAAAALAASVSLAASALLAGVVFRNPRPFELALLVGGYASMQGGWWLNVLAAPDLMLSAHLMVALACGVLLPLAWRRLSPGLEAGALSSAG